MTAQWSKQMVPGHRGVVYRFVRDAEMIPGVRCEVDVDLHGHKYPSTAAAAMLAALQRLEADHDETLRRRRPRFTGRGVVSDG